MPREVNPKKTTGASKEEGRMSQEGSPGLNKRRQQRQEQNTDQHDNLFQTTFGHEMSSKDEEVIRIATLNLRTFPLNQRDRCKSDALRHELMQSDADVLGLTETNYNWTQMESKEQLHHQTRGWWKNKHIQKAWMRTEQLNKNQTGGTATIVTGDTTSYKTQGGEDLKKMGRWSWVTLSDPKEDIHTTIITLYQPCHNRGTMSTYTQQLETIRQEQPTSQLGVFQHYIRDLDRLLTEKKEQHHQLIVMGDFNEDTRDKKRLVQLLEKHQLYNPILQKYGKTTTTYMYGGHHWTPSTSQTP